MKPLPQEFYDRDAATVAQALLGMLLVHVAHGVRRVGRIVETEAYLGPHDLASHSSRGRTPRTEVMFGPPGRAYVYLIYGMYWCMNAVCEKEGVAAAALIRALEPVENIKVRTQGPGLLCRAMNITKVQHGQSLQSPDFFIAAPGTPTPFSVVKTTRIGVDYAGLWALKPLRFFIKDNPFVSKPAQTRPSKRRA